MVNSAQGVRYDADRISFQGGMMQCFECGYQCSPYDHTERGTNGAPTWQCERCGWACKVNDTPKDVEHWRQAMAMQMCVDEQMARDWTEWPDD